MNEPKRKRRWFLKVLLLLLVVLAASLAYLRRTTIRNWFESEREDTAAIQKLEKADLTPVPVVNTIDWPQWRGPNRDGIAPAGPLNTNWEATPPRLVWSAPCGGGYSSFAAAGDTVYTQDKMNGNERVVALDITNGNIRWAYDSAVDYAELRLGFTGGPRATPTVHEGRVYAAGAVGSFVCLDAKTGKELWKKDLKAEYDIDLPSWGLAGSPLVDGKLIIVQPGGRKGAVVAFDRISGSQVWASNGGPAGYSSPIVATIHGMKQIITVTGDAVWGLDAATGTQIWAYDWVTEYKGNIATPIVAGNYIFVSSNYAKGCALLDVEQNGTGMKAKEVYFRKNRVMRNHHSSSIFKDGFLYGCDNERFVCVDLRKGQAVPDWDSSDSGIGKGCIILAGNHLLGLTQNGTLFLADANPKEFNLVAKLKDALTGNECWALPVLVNGKLYIRNNEIIKCYDVK